MSGTTVLTAGQDIVLPLDDDQLVTGTSDTLTSRTPSYAGGTLTYTAGDRLDGGAGYDVLSLTGSGSFNLQGLEQFTGFEEVRLVNTTSSSASLTLRDGVDLTVTLSDGSAPSTSGFPTHSPGINVILGTGLVTLHGGNEDDTISATAAGKLRAGSLIDGGSGQNRLSLSYEYPLPLSRIDPVTGLMVYVPPAYRDTVYDLTSISLSHVETLELFGSAVGTTVIAKVDTTTLADVTSIYATTGAKLVTGAATLDLTNKFFSGGMIESSNATGTTFTTDSVATALKIQGGNGQDTLVVSGLTLTSAQRDQIFTGSVESITDAAGTFTKAATPAGTTVLTLGQDIVLPLDGDQVVSATSATLTSGTPSYVGATPTYTGGDRLDGGAGYDVLSLTGSGSFNLQALGQFTGFEEVRLTNAALSPSSLILRDGVDLTVVLGDGSAPSTTGFPTYSLGTSVTLGTGVVTVRGSNGSDSILVSASGKLRAGSVIDGGAGSDSLSLSYEYPLPSFPIDPVTGLTIYLPPVYRDTVYDLTGISLSHVESLNVNGISGGRNGNTATIVKVDTAALADVTFINGFGGKLVTAAATLDLTGKSINGVFVESTNVTGTTFTVGSYQTAQQVQGGTGQDAIILRGVTLTSAQRDQLFTSSIETLTDASGTYTKTAPPVAVTVLTGTADGDRLVAPSAANWTLNGLGGNDTLVGGAGNDTLDGGDGTDTVVLSGQRSNYTFTKSGTGLSVKDLRGSASDGTDLVTNVEAFQFLGGEAKPNGTIQSGFATETLQGTSARDVFFFDTALGLKLGADTLEGFDAGDRLVTTSKLYDGNNDGRITTSSDRFQLPDTVYDAVSDTGTVKLVATSGQTVKALVLTGTTDHDGVTYYSYAAAGDTETGTGVSFNGVVISPEAKTYGGTAEADTFTAVPGSTWTIDGFGGDDTLTGAERKDMISGGVGNDRLKGGGGNDVIDGGAGIDNAVFVGHRGDYSFVKTTAGLVVTGSGTGAPDGVDTLKGVETFEFLGGSGRPVGAITSTYAGETLTGMKGTATHDTFYFDTDAGLALGADTILNFGNGDRLVTTSRIFDGNNDGIITIKSGASFTLPGTSADAVADSAGSVKLLTDAGKAISSLKLLDAHEVHDGVTYFTYAAVGDLSLHAELLFA